MSGFLHTLAEGLRTREKFLEDHAQNPVFDTEDGKPFKKEYDKLVADVQTFGDRIRKMQEAGDDYDEHFEKEIGDQTRQLSIKIDTWSKNLPAKH